MCSDSLSFHTAVFDALCACLDLDRASAEAVSLIHEAYAEPENVPRPPRSRNVVYWTGRQYLAPDPVPVSYASEAGSPGCHVQVVYSTLKYQLVIVCYGPDAEKYACRIRSMLFLDGPGFPRKILRSAGLYPVPDPLRPSVLYEEEASLWRKRADLTVRLRVRDEQRSSACGSIAAAPAVIIHRWLNGKTPSAQREKKGGKV